MSLTARLRAIMDDRLTRRSLIRRSVGSALLSPFAAGLATRSARATTQLGTGFESALLTRLRRRPGGGTLVVGAEGDIESLDPGHATTLVTARAQHLLYEGLLRYAPGGVDLIPQLATAVPSVDNGGITPDGLRYTFRLRRGVRFHDGSPVDAAAVQLSYRRLFDETSPVFRPNRWRSSLADLAEVDVLDPYTVRFTLARPTALFLDMVAVYAGKVVAPKAIRDGASLGERTAVGTGPYRLKRWDRGTELVLERNPAYWGQRPRLARVVFRPIPEGADRVSALRRGRLDMIVGVPPEAMEAIQTDDRLAHALGPSLGSWFVEIVAEGGPFRDLRVRRAANHAVDKERLVRSVLHGTVLPATQPVPAGDWTYDPAIPGLPYDPVTARRLLRDAGFDGGFGTRLLVPPSDPTAAWRANAVDQIADELKQVGIEVEIQQFDWSPYLDLWANEHGLLPDAGASQGGTVEVLDSDFPRVGASYSSSRMWAAEPEENSPVGALLGNALRTLDREERRRRYRQAWHTIAEEAPRIFVADDLQPVAFRSTVEGYVTNPNYLIDFADMWIDRE